MTKKREKLNWKVIVLAKRANNTSRTRITKDQFLNGLTKVSLNTFW